MKYVICFLFICSGLTFSQKDTIFLMDDTWKAGVIGKGTSDAYKIYTDSGSVLFIPDLQIDKIKFSDGRYIKLEHDDDTFYGLYNAAWITAIAIAGFFVIKAIANQ